MVIGAVLVGAGVVPSDVPTMAPSPASVKGLLISVAYVIDELG